MSAVLARSTTGNASKVFPRLTIRWLLIVCAVLLAAWFGWRYWHSSQLHASTDDAYVNADKVEIAAQVQSPCIAPACSATTAPPKAAMH